MCELVRRESPLTAVDQTVGGDVPHRRPGVVLAEKPFLGHLNMRGDPAASGFSAAVRRVLGFDLPLDVNTVTAGRTLAVFWLGPDEWLILTPGGRESGVMHDLRAALHEQFAAVTDVSGGQTVIMLGGECARDVLAKGCSLDLHPRVFGPGQCAQTHLARTGVLIRQVDDTPTFELIVRRSLADYLWRWLQDASAEYGPAVTSDAETEAPVHAAASSS